MYISLQTSYAERKYNIKYISVIIINAQVKRCSNSLYSCSASHDISNITPGFVRNVVLDYHKQDNFLHLLINLSQQ